MILKPGVYGYHGLEVGDCLETGSREITPALIDDFARVSGDRVISQVALATQIVGKIGLPLRGQTLGRFTSRFEFFAEVLHGTSSPRSHREHGGSRKEQPEG